MGRKIYIHYIEHLLVRDIDTIGDPVDLVFTANYSLGEEESGHQLEVVPGRLFNVIGLCKVMDKTTSDVLVIWLNNSLVFVEDVHGQIQISFHP